MQVGLISHCGTFMSVMNIHSRILRAHERARAGEECKHESELEIKIVNEPEENALRIRFTLDVRRVGRRGLGL